MSQFPLGAWAQSSDDKVNKTSPDLNTLRTPLKSAMRPMGKSKMAVVSKKPVTIQLKATACIENSASMAGSAMLMEEMRKVPIKEVMATMARMESCCRLHCIIKVFCL